MAGRAHSWVKGVVAPGRIDCDGTTFGETDRKSLAAASNLEME